ncbi:hypothetical protein SKAU_G00260240 [Synaphobranchus kaupii]|uniref:Uncharacterized protein n=1 Tax=Synaphobranchus kaupii TaxID=118154 RepID=A0A9Q1F4L5_SYNKA|nr:hypothetical protein SKAU_G00260240 [Synaphobranchus kaupii]
MAISVAQSSPGGECGALPNAIGSSRPSSSMDNSAQTARGPAAEHPEARKPRLNSGPPSPDTGGSAPAALGPAAGLPDQPGRRGWFFCQRAVQGPHYDIAAVTRRCKQADLSLPLQTSMKRDFPQKHELLS